MKTNVLAAVCMIAAMTGCRKQADLTEKLYVFNLDSIVKHSHGDLEWLESREFNQRVVTFSPQQDHYNITLTAGLDSIPWKRSTYLVLDILNKSGYSAIVYVDFYKAGEENPAGIAQPATEFTEQPRISPKVGVLPDLKTKLVIPLSHLDGQEIFMKRFRRQLKGTVMGHRLDITDIGRVMLRFEPVMLPDYFPQIKIARIYLTDTIPSPFEKPEKPYVDEFGQWNLKAWPGKVHNIKELKDNMMALELSVKDASFPDQWSRYGGWKALRFASCSIIFLR